MGALSRYPWPRQFAPRFVFALPTRWRTHRAAQERARCYGGPVLRSVSSRREAVIKVVRMAASMGRFPARSKQMSIHATTVQVIASALATPRVFRIVRVQTVSDDQRLARASDRAVRDGLGLARMSMGQAPRIAQMPRDRIPAREIVEATIRAYSRVRRISEYSVDSRTGAVRVSIGRLRRISSVPDLHLSRGRTRASQVARQVERRGLTVTARLRTVAQNRQAWRDLRSLDRSIPSDHNSERRRFYARLHRAGERSNRERVRIFDLPRIDMHASTARVACVRFAAHAAMSRSPSLGSMLRRIDRNDIAALVRIPAARSLSFVAVPLRRMRRPSDVLTSSESPRPPATARLILQRRAMAAASPRQRTAAARHAYPMSDTHRSSLPREDEQARDHPLNELAIAAARRILIPLVQEALFSERTIGGLASGVATAIDRRDRSEQYRKSGGR